MLRRCLFCHRSLPCNSSLQYFGVGRRVAFDPERGRLWAVCPGCARWSLAPIEERWEALEELEKLARDRARLLAQTENIALLRAGELEVVRIGRAELREEAWWRYGRELARRHARGQALLWADVALALTIGVPVIRSLGRWRAFADGVWLGVHRCPTCGASLTGGATSLKRTSSMTLGADAAGDLALKLSCRYCDSRGESGQIAWSGAEARRILRTALAYHNFEGGDARAIDAACQRISDAGSAEGLVRVAAGSGAMLASFMWNVSNKPLALALEMSLGDTEERRLLAAEAAAIEEHWREEERIAAIMDRELTPVPQIGR